MDPKTLDNLARKVADAMPAGLRVMQEDLERNLRAALQSALGKLDLVTREEFDVQAAVLARTREKLEALEGRVATLEKALLDRDVAEVRSASDENMDGG